MSASGARVWLIAGAVLPLPCAFAAWQLSSPGGGTGDLIFFAYWLVLAGIFVAWAMVALAWLVLLVRVIVLRLRTGRRDSNVHLLLAGAVTIVLGAALFSGLPLRLRLELSEAALADAAREREPGRAGLYSIERIQAGPGGSTVLITGRCAGSDCGFAYAPERPPPEICEDSDYQTYEHISGPWYEAVLSPAGPCG